jgi:hypothetical protein
MQMVYLFAHGVGFAFIYYHRTDNLLIAVGVHSLVCTPLSLFLPQTAGSMIVIVTGLMLAFFWPLLPLKASRTSRCGGSDWIRVVSRLHHPKHVGCRQQPLPQHGDPCSGRSEASRRRSQAVSPCAPPDVLRPVPAGLAVLGYVFRHRPEDRTLRAELPGHKEYTHRTRYCLVPGVW